MKDEAWCWYMRFDHFNFGALKALGEEKMVKEMHSINHRNQLCETCLLDKHSRSFPKEATTRAIKPLQLVYTDVCVDQSIHPHLIKISFFFSLLIIIVERFRFIF